MRRRAFLPFLPLAAILLVSAAFPPQDHANLDIAGIGLAPTDAPVLRHFDTVRFAIHSTAQIDVDGGRSREKSPIVVQIDDFGSNDLTASWLGSMLLEEYADEPSCHSCLCYDHFCFAPIGAVQRYSAARLKRTLDPCGPYSGVRPVMAVRPPLTG